jgi:hypothetical protein
MRGTAANSETLEWRFENKYWDIGSKTIKEYEVLKGKCRAVYQYMTLMSLVQYHKDG